MAPLRTYTKASLVSSYSEHSQGCGPLPGQLLLKKHLKVKVLGYSSFEKETTLRTRNRLRAKKRKTRKGDTCKTVGTVKAPIDTQRIKKAMNTQGKTHACEKAQEDPKLTFSLPANSVQAKLKG